MTSLRFTFIFIPPLFWPGTWRLLKIHLTPAIEVLFYIHREESGQSKQGVKVVEQRLNNSQREKLWNGSKERDGKMFSEADMEGRQFEVRHSAKFSTFSKQSPTVHTMKLFRNELASKTLSSIIWTSQRAWVLAPPPLDQLAFCPTCGCTSRASDLPGSWNPACLVGGCM